MKYVTSLILILCSGIAFAQMSQEAAFEAGKSAGDQPKREAIFNNATAATGGHVMRDYQNSAAESSHYTGRNTAIGGMLSSGSSKISACNAGATINSVDKQHCEAVNLIANQYQHRPPNIIPPGDPLINAGRAATANPDVIAGSMGGGLTNCTTKTVTTPSTFTTESCESFSDRVNNHCSMGQEVVVDPDYIYQCTETVKTIAASSCTYGRVVQVDADYNYQCTNTVSKTNQYTCSRINNVTVTQQCSGSNQSNAIVRVISNGMYYNAPAATAWAQQYAGQYCNEAYPGSTAISTTYLSYWAIGDPGGMVQFYYRMQFVCQVQTISCWNVISVSTSNGCAALEARS